MADRYLLESGAPDGYQLEDASGVLSLEGVDPPLDDDESSWWSGVARNFVGIAVAGIVATNALAAQLPLHARSLPDEVPPYTAAGDAGVIGTFISVGASQPVVRYGYGLEDEVPRVLPTFDEDYWQNPVAPEQAKLLYPQPWSGEQGDEAPTLPTFDEDYWQNPVAPIPASLTYPKPWLGEQVGEVPIFTASGDAGTIGTFASFGASEPIFIQVGGLEDELPSALVFVPDEDFYRPLLPLCAPYTLPPSAFTADDEAPHVQPDEDYWQNPVIPVAAAFAVPNPAAWEQNEQAAGLYGQPDEDFWNNPVRPNPATLAVPPQWQYEQGEQAAGLYGVPVEPEWTSPVAPVAASLRYPQPWTWEQNENAAGLYGVPEEAEWRNPRPATQPLQIVQVFAADDDLPVVPAAALVAEDDPLSLRVPTEGSRVTPAPWQYEQNDIAVTPVNALDDNAAWVPIPAARLATSIQPVALEDDLPILSVAEDEVPALRVVQPAYRFIAPFTADDAFTAPAAGFVVDEDASPTPIRSVQISGLSFVYPAPWSFDEGARSNLESSFIAAFNFVPSITATPVIVPDLTAGHSIVASITATSSIDTD